MNTFDLIITCVNNDIGKINIVDSFLAKNQQFVITHLHMEYVIDTINNNYLLNKLIHKFINFGYVPSNHIIVKILNCINENIRDFVIILLKTNKNKKIIFNDDTFNLISQKLKTYTNYYYYIWRIIHENRYIINNNIFKQIHYICDYDYDNDNDIAINLIRYKHYNVSYNDLINYISNKYKIYPNNGTLLHACYTGNALLYNHSIKHGIFPSTDCITEMYNLTDFSEKSIKYIIYDIIDNKIISTIEQLDYFKNNNVRLYNIFNNVLYYSYNVSNILFI